MRQNIALSFFNKIAHSFNFVYVLNRGACGYFFIFYWEFGTLQQTVVVQLN